MNKSLFAIAIVALSVCSCSDDITPTLEPGRDITEVPALENPEEYHQKMRTVPYPRINNRLYINPAPLIVPQSMKNSDLLQFQLSPSADFVETSAILSDPVAWNMWNCHRELAPGTWYWRFRDVDSDGTPGSWSETYSFEVRGDEPVFVTPDSRRFLDMAPRFSPRLYCFLDSKLDAARASAPSHPEYASLTQRADRALDVDYNTGLDALYSNHDNLYAHVECLYQAYLLTLDRRYADKLAALLRAMTDNPVSDSVLYSDNFITSTVTYAHAAICDLLGEQLPAARRRAAQQFVASQCERFLSVSAGYEENHIFDNHFWQINCRLMFFAALSVYDCDQYPAARKLLEYIYELWTARAPASGFNRDGLWHNGTGYFPTNTKTLAYMPLMLSYITRTDFTRHPWYAAAGQALSFTMPPTGVNIGFGDGHERNAGVVRQVAAFADFLARETGDGYAAWYASASADILRTDWDMRIYRMCNQSSDYDGALPADTPLLTWYKDAGEVAVHSALDSPEDDLAIGFRSSQFGSGSHTTSSQNAFNLSFGGKTVFCSSGYYQNFSDAHNLMWYRHSRGHNTVLVNGIGQPYTTRAYGRILRAGSTSSIAYALGDASNAYCGYTDDPMWIENFRKAGIDQSPANGFGPTPLTRYYRHIVMLRPGVMLVYDELEASEAARWEWLLHSPVAFDIDTENGTLTTVNAADRSHCRVTIAMSEPADMSQTSQFLVPPAIRGPEYPDQWHFTARVDNSPKIRVLAIIQPADISDDFTEVTRDGSSWHLGDWTITASLDTSELPALHIANRRTGAMLDAGTRPEVCAPDGTTVCRNMTPSTIIADGKTLLELTDTAPVGSRNAR